MKWIFLFVCYFALQSFHIRSSLLLYSLFLSFCLYCSCSPCWMVLPAEKRGGRVGGGCSRSMSTHDSVSSAECKFPVHNALRLLSLWNFCHLLCLWKKKNCFLLFVFKAPSCTSLQCYKFLRVFFHWQKLQTAGIVFQTFFSKECLLKRSRYIFRFNCNNWLKAIERTFFIFSFLLKWIQKTTESSKWIWWFNLIFLIG